MLVKMSFSRQFTVTLAQRNGRTMTTTDMSDPAHKMRKNYQSAEMQRTEDGKQQICLI